MKTIARILTALVILATATAASGQSITTYKGIQELSPQPTATGGLMYHDNFRTIENRVGNYVTGFVGVPDVDQDIDYTTNAWTNSFWTDSALGTDPLYLCRDNTNGAAVWERLILEATSTGAITFIGATDTDIVHTFDGTTSDGVMTWMEDEAEFRFDSDIKLPGNTNFIRVGQGNSTSISNPAFLADRAVNLSGVNAHAFGDETTYDLSGGNDAANSFDCKATISGTANYNHFVGFQSRPIYSSQGDIGSFGGYTTLMVIEDDSPQTGSVTTHAYGYKHNAINVQTGTLPAQYAFWNEDLLDDSTIAYAFYDAAENDNFFNGRLGIDIAPATGGSAFNVSGGTNGQTDWFSVFNNSDNEIAAIYTDSGADGVFDLNINDATNMIRLQAAGDSYFLGGDVGIGTTSPDGKLHVLDDDITKFVIQENTGTTDDTAGLYFKTSSNTDDSLMKPAIINEDNGDGNLRGALYIGVDTADDAGIAEPADLQIKIDGLTGVTAIGDRTNEVQVGPTGDVSFAGSAEFILPSGTSLPGTANVGSLFLDTDAGTNGTIYCYANGGWRAVVVLP